MKEGMPQARPKKSGKIKSGTEGGSGVWGIALWTQAQRSKTFTPENFLIFHKLSVKIIEFTAVLFFIYCQNAKKYCHRKYMPLYFTYVCSEGGVQHRYKDVQYAFGYMTSFR